MAGETYLLSGDQLATYSIWTESYPPPDFVPHLDFTDVAPLGGADDRFFLVRTSGTSDTVSNGDLFVIYPAIDDGNGNLIPGPTPIVSSSLATPDAYGGAVAGDSYVVLGMYAGDRVIVNLAGFDGENEFQAVQGQDGDGDGELNLSEIEDANPDAAPCFVAGSLIETARGNIPIETCQIGEMVVTLDHGLQPVRHVARRRIRLLVHNEHLRPVRLHKNAISLQRPDRDVCVSPQHRVLVGDWRAELVFGTDDVFIPAKFLVDGENVELDWTATSVDYVHLIFDEHEIVNTSGLLSESFHPGKVGLSALSAASRREHLEIFPDLEDFTLSNTKTSRMVAKSFEAKVLMNLQV